MKCYRDKNRVCDEDCVAYTNRRKRVKALNGTRNETTCRVVNAQEETAASADLIAYRLGSHYRSEGDQG